MPDALGGVLVHIDELVGLDQWKVATALETRRADKNDRNALEGSLMRPRKDLSRGAVPPERVEGDREHDSGDYSTSITTRSR
uniref:Unannotated protein n=1 Tax=freshwater metagenome TaxID=449393 RepID=A0A6J7PHQ0_9ZZZZ